MTNKHHFAYKGYTGSIEHSTEDMCLFGKVQMIQDLIMYDGETLTELKASFEAAVDEYLEMCIEEGKNPNKPCSGTFNIRMSEELHRQCINEANVLGLNLNKFINKCVDNYFYEKELKKNYVLVDVEPIQYVFNESIHYDPVLLNVVAPTYKFEIETKGLC
jgi:predicted HicB family RNase H-like nuclease